MSANQLLEHRQLLEACYFITSQCNDMIMAETPASIYGRSCQNFYQITVGNSELSTAQTVFLVKHFFPTCLIVKDNNARIYSIHLLP
jgi:hypothetical protein